MIVIVKNGLLFVFLMILISLYQAAYANSCPVDKKYAKPPDGCSSWSDNPEQVRDSWGPVNFATECDKHDVCYFTLGTTPEECNNAFRENLFSACRNGTRKCWKTPFGRKCTPPEPVSYSACTGIATTMYTAVVLAEDNVHKKAQNAQKKYEKKCDEISRKSSKCQNIANIEIRPGTKNILFEKGKSWETCTGYLMAFQDDGNLMVYNPFGDAVWSSKTNKRGDLLAVQADGNLVIYSHGKPIWTPNTHGNPGAFLAIQQDGNMVMYNKNGKALWAAGTNGK